MKLKSAKRTGRAASACKLVLALPQQASSNLAQWCRVLVRAPRAPRAHLPRLPASAIAAIILTLAATVASMFLIDAAASDWARHLPHWFTDAFEQITNFGLGGWFLFPFGFIVLCLAAVKSPALPRLTQGVLVALGARFGFLFFGDRCAGPVRDHRQADDRPRPPLCRRP